MSDLQQCPECCGTGRHEPFKAGPFSPCRICNGEAWGPPWKRAAWREEQSRALLTTPRSGSREIEEGHDG